MSQQQSDKYATCTEHGEVEIIPTTNGTEYVELCPHCENEAARMHYIEQRPCFCDDEGICPHCENLER